MSASSQQREPREWYGGLLGTARIVLDEKNDDPELMSGLLYPLAEGVIELVEQLEAAREALERIARMTDTEPYTHPRGVALAPHIAQAALDSIPAKTEGPETYWEAVADSSPARSPQ